MKSISKIILPLFLVFLFSCKAGDYYRPIDIRQEAYLMTDSINTVFVFSVPLETKYHPAGAVVEDNMDILKVYLVRAMDNVETPKIDIPVKMVKDDAMLMSRGYKPTSYYLTLPTKGRGFRFCNQGGCGDLNTQVENSGASKED
jgi:hypothetical protein